MITLKAILARPSIHVVDQAIEEYRGLLEDAYMASGTGVGSTIVGSQYELILAKLETLIELKGRMKQSGLV